MAKHVNRRTFLYLASVACLAALSGCSQNDASDTTAQTGADLSRQISVGTLATEDILPFWVAESEDLFAQNGLNVSIVPFQSATELIAGVSSGEVDIAMTDIMVTAGMFAGGVDVKMIWVTLGTDASQGRFGIMAGPQSEVQELKDLAGVPIGVGSNTILEYVMDKLMEAAGIPANEIIVEELQKLPVRYQAMLSGDVAAAALPGTLLALGEANGCKLIADDTTGDNISQSVMIARNKYAQDETGQKQIAALQEIWDRAADLINTEPEKYRAVLIEHANLPQEIAETYPISTYPKAQLPTSAMVDPVLAWMEQKGYLAKPLEYHESDGTFSAK